MSENEYIEVEDDFPENKEKNSEDEFIIINDKKYVPVYTPNWRDFAYCLKRAKGPNRSMGAFAEECGLSPATFTRIVKGYYKRRLKKVYLEKILEKADPNSSISLLELAMANGYGREGAYDDIISRNKSYELIPSEWRETMRREDLYEVLSRELFKRGLEFTTYSKFDQEKIVPQGKLELNNWDIMESFDTVTFHIQGFEPKYLKYSGGIRNELRVYDKETLWSSLGLYKDLFLRDAWEPEAARDFSYTIVFRVETAFNVFVENMQNVRVNNYFSAILVDTENKTVVEEFAIPRVEGEPLKIFGELNVL